MSFVLDLLDHLGRRVTLAESTWFQKILTKHPRVANFGTVEIPRAVSTPDFVNLDKEYMERACHYLVLEANSRGQHRFLKVVIEYNGGTTNGKVEGKVISIYIASRVPSSEVRIWP